MLYKEINQKFTDVVNSYLAEGYHFNTGTMGGEEDSYSCGNLSFSDLAKVDLTNGSQTVRVNLGSFSYHENDKQFYGIRLSVKVSYIKAIADRERNIDNFFGGETILEQRFYQIKYPAKWYGTKEEAIAQQEKAKKREEERRRLELLRRRMIEFDLAKAAPIVFPYVRRQPRCENVKLSDISGVAKDNRDSAFYFVRVEGKTTYTITR